MSLIVFIFLYFLQFSKAKLVAEDFLITKELPLVNYSHNDASLLEHYAGIIPIQIDGSKPDKDDPGLFFWLFRAKYSQVNETKKVVIWLNGGPGCSSMLGALAGHAPLRFDDSGNLNWNNQSWNTFTDVIYLDQPVGTGYSFVTSKGQIPLRVTRASRDFVQFLLKMYEIFPDLSKKDLYIAGESYAGVWIPYFAKTILDGNLARKHDIPLKGILIGNGLIWPEILYETFVEWPIIHGYLPPSPQLINASKTLEKCHEAYRNGPDRIHVPICDTLTDIVLNVGLNGTDCRNWYDMRLVMPECNLDVYPKSSTYLDTYLIRQDVTEALHVKNGKKPAWSSCDSPVEEKMNYDTSTPPYRLLPFILENGIEVLLYSGEFDLACNSLHYEYGIGNLTWNGKTGLDQDVVSYVMNGKTRGKVVTDRNLTYFLINDSGHMVPTDVPDVALDMLHRFIGISSIPLMDPRAKVKGKVGPWLLIVLVILMGIALILWSMLKSEEGEIYL